MSDRTFAAALISGCILFTILLALACYTATAAQPVDYRQAAAAIHDAQRIGAKSNLHRAERWRQASKTIGKPNHWYERARPLVKACRDRAALRAKQLTFAQHDPEFARRGAFQYKRMAATVPDMEPSEALRSYPCEVLKQVCLRLARADGAVLK